MSENIPILQIQGLHVRLAGKTILEDINLSIWPQLRYGLLGPNGGGKTTLLKAILGLVRPDSGKIFFLGEELHRNTRGRRKIGYVPQNHTFLSDYPIEVEELLAQALVTSLRPFRKLSSQEKDRLHFYLDLLGISHLRKQVVRSLSGGELQRALIARALAGRPKLLLLDEPLSHLDPDSKEKLYQSLAELSREMAILMVSHETASIATHFAEVFFLNQRMLYQGKASQAQRRLREFSKQWIF